MASGVFSRLASLLEHSVSHDSPSDTIKLHGDHRESNPTRGKRYDASPPPSESAETRDDFATFIVAELRWRGGSALISQLGSIVPRNLRVGSLKSQLLGVSGVTCSGTKAVLVDGLLTPSANASQWIASPASAVAARGPTASAIVPAVAGSSHAHCPTAHTTNPVAHSTTTVSASLTVEPPAAAGWSRAPQHAVLTACTTRAAVSTGVAPSTRTLIPGGGADSAHVQSSALSEFSHRDEFAMCIITELRRHGGSAYISQLGAVVPKHLRVAGTPFKSQLVNIAEVSCSGQIATLLEPLERTPSAATHAVGPGVTPASSLDLAASCVVAPVARVASSVNSTVNASEFAEAIIDILTRQGGSMQASTLCSRIPRHLRVPNMMSHISAVRGVSVYQTTLNAFTVELAPPVIPAESIAASSSAPLNRASDSSLTSHVRHSVDPPDLSIFGYVFMSSSQTNDECLSRMLFGGPTTATADVLALVPGSSVLFLCDVSARVIRGTFTPTSPGGVLLEPNAWKAPFVKGVASPYPAQV